MDSLQTLLEPKLNYWVAIALIMIGLYAMVIKKNLFKKLIGMGIFQAAIILFFVSISVKKDATIPILREEIIYSTQEEYQGIEDQLNKQQMKYAEHSLPGQNTAAASLEHKQHPAIKASDYANPLPHVLMLTAIVVGVATLGVGLAVLQKVHHGFGSIEENEIADALSREVDKTS